MRSDAPPLLPIFRSRHQADFLTWLFLHPDGEYPMSDLARRLDVPLTTVQREANRLEAATLVRSRTIGRSRLFQANSDHPAAAILTRLLELSFGPRPVIEEEFAELPGVGQVLIYGSWAERYQGAEGRPPQDIDVLVIGQPERDLVYEAADRAQSRLGIPVNPVVRSAEQWREASDALIAQIKSSANVVVLRNPAT